MGFILPLLLSLLTALFLVSGCFFVTPVMALDKSEWVLQQKDFEDGSCQLYLTEDAVRVVNLDRGFEALAAAPDWKVVLFRRPEKISFVTNLNGFRNFSPLGVGDGAWRKYAHLKPLYTAKAKDSPFILAHFKTPDDHEISLIQDIVVAGEVSLFLQDYYHLAMPGVPFQVLCEFPVSVRKKDSNWLSDTSADFAGKKVWLKTLQWKKVSYNSADFKYPEGYRVTTDQTQILLSRKRANTLNSIINEFDKEDKAAAAKERLKRMRRSNSGI